MSRSEHLNQTRETLEASLELLKILRDTRHSDSSVEDLELLRRRIFNAAAMTTWHTFTAPLFCVSIGE